MIDGYLLHMQRRRRASGTIRLRMHYVTHFATWLGRDLATAEHDDMLRFLDAHHWKPSTRQSADASLKAFYGWAHREGHLAVNPARDLPVVIVPRGNQRMATEEAIGHAIECDDLSDRAMVLLGAECGLRVTEIARLHISNRDGDWLRLIGKGGVEREVQLSPELATLLGEIERDLMRHGWYFPGRSGIRPLHSSTAWRHISVVLGSNPHSLRRRAGTVVYRRSGNDLRLAQVFLGHASSDTTAGYLNVTRDDLARAGALSRIAA